MPQCHVWFAGALCREWSGGSTHPAPLGRRVQYRMRRSSRTNTTLQIAHAHLVMGMAVLAGPLGCMVGRRRNGRMIMTEPARRDARGVRR